MKLQRQPLVVSNSNFKFLFKARPNSIPTFGIRMHQHVLDSGIYLSSIAKHSTSPIPLWVLKPSIFIPFLYIHGSKSVLSSTKYRAKFNVILSEYNGHTRIFTDGSNKWKDGGSWHLFSTRVCIKRLPYNSSIFSAEARSSSNITVSEYDFSSVRVISSFFLSDSLSCLWSSQSRNISHPLIAEIFCRVSELKVWGFSFIFIWVPSLVAFADNSVANAAAKAALNLPVTNVTIPYSDYNSLIWTRASYFSSHQNSLCKSRF